MVGNHQTSIYKWLFGVPGCTCKFDIPSMISVMCEESLPSQRTQLSTGRQPGGSMVLRGRWDARAAEYFQMPPFFERKGPIASMYGILTYNKP